MQEAAPAPDAGHNIQKTCGDKYSKIFSIRLRGDYSQIINIIAASKIKKTLPVYDPGKSDLIHKRSAQLADKEFAQALRDYAEKIVVIMAGGSASGKTEYVSAYLKQRRIIVFDGTLPSFKGARIKIRKSLKANKNSEIHFVLPASLSKAFFTFLTESASSQRHIVTAPTAARGKLLASISFAQLGFVFFGESHLRTVVQSERFEVFARYVTKGSPGSLSETLGPESLLGQDRRRASCLYELRLEIVLWNWLTTSPFGLPTVVLFP